MEVVQIPISELRPADYNPRELTAKQFEDLAESIRRFGFVDPLVVNRHKTRRNIIVGGHQRYNVAMSLGLAELPCVYVNLPLEKERELNLRLNKNLGQWDRELLANFDSSELLGAGFSAEELDRMFDLGLQDPEPEPEPDVPSVVLCPNCGHEFSVLQEAKK